MAITKFVKKSVSKIPDYSIFSRRFHRGLIKLIKFETISFFGRLFLTKKPPKIDIINRFLNLGCGETEFPGWVNADFFIVKFWRVKHNRWMLDLRYPLHCEDEYWDGIFSEHTIEHLFPNQAMSLFHELHRTLKKSGWLRITVPDLQKYVDFYTGNVPHENFHRWRTGAEAIRSLTQNFYHLSVWDEKLLKKFLTKAGFINIKKVSFRKGSDPRLLKDSEQRKWETLYMEAQKSHIKET